MKSTSPTERRLLPWLVLALMVALSMVLAFLGSAAWLDGSRGDVAPAPGADSPPTGDVVGVIDAGGQSQFIDCRGSGGPTAVLVAGVWGWSKDWEDHILPWRSGGRVCTYDRPGLGASEPRRGSLEVDAGIHAQELRELLDAAGEPGPFLMVGHSYGGLVVRSFTSLYPESVTGLLLLDTVPPGIESQDPGYGTSREEGGAMISLPASSEASGYDRPLSGLPVVVLSGQTPNWDPQRTVAWDEGQDRAARASGRSIRLTAVGASHQLQVTAPAAVDMAFNVIRSGLRSQSFQPGCHEDWAAVGVDCQDMNGG